jgi:hypothetical protein
MLKGVSNMSCKTCGESRYYSPQTGCYPCHSRESDAKVERAKKLYEYLEQPQILMSLPQPHRLAISELLHGDHESILPKIDAYEAIKAEVIRMRSYVMRKSIGIGECVAWNRIKDYYGAGRCDIEDFTWLQEYEQRNTQ